MLRGLTYHAAATVDGLAPADAVVVCGRDDAEAFHLALNTPSAWAGAAKSLTMNVTHGAQADALFGSNGIGLLDDLNGVLEVVPTSQLIAQSHSGVLVHEPVIDRMAKAALRTNLRQIELEGFVPPHGEHLVPWDQMDDAARQRHRQRIATIPPILAALEANDWKVVPFTAGMGVSLTPDIIERMARDIYSTTDPGKESFDSLPPDVKQLKVTRVSHLPETLAQLGLGITNISKHRELSAIGQVAAPAESSV